MSREHGMKLFTDEQLTITELPIFCQKVAQDLLLSDQRVCLWLSGELGAGKTSWVDVFLHTIGLSSKVTVSSPTYTYACEYQINDKLYLHGDLYRISTVAEYQQLAIVATNYHGLFLEWATPNNCLDHPTHQLLIDFSETTEKRRYRLIDLHNS